MSPSADPRARYTTRDTARIPWWPVVLAIAVFLAASWNPRHYWDEYFYLYSVLTHSPSELVALEPTVGLFPRGFYSAKIAFVSSLWVLVKAFGPGWGSLFVIQGVFAVLGVGLAAAAYGLLSEVLGDRTWARRSSVVLLFLPVSLYLAGKVLSEIPSLLGVTLGSWALMRSFRHDPATERPRIALLLALGVLGIVTGTLMRFTAALAPAGLVVGLFAGEPRIPRRHLVHRALIVGVASLGLVIAVQVLLGDPGGRFADLYNSVAGRSTVGWNQRVYALGLFVQLFAPVVLIGAWRSREAAVRVIAIWTAVCTLPFLWGYEPRLYYLSLVPMAPLAELGLTRLSSAIAVRHTSLVRWALLAGITAVNLAVFRPVMPYEVDQASYARLIDSVDRARPNALYLVPWLSDFAFLSFVYPAHRVRLTASEASTSGTVEAARTIPLAPPAQSWAGRDRYIASIETLERQAKPRVYVGWTFNPAIVRLSSYAHRIGVDLGDPRRHGLHNHLETSWLWKSPKVALHEIARRGQYHVFDVVDPREVVPGP